MGVVAEAFMAYVVVRRIASAAAIAWTLGVFLFLHTDNFDRDDAAFRGRGVQFVREPREQPYGTVPGFRDPWGNLWDLVQSKHRGDG
jgi:uncharacterized glyoxalase superfamily protein PhnB